MKKVILAITAVALPMMMHAQSEGLFARKAQKGNSSDMSVYTAKGSIPEKDGSIAFSDVIMAAGKSKSDIYAKLAQWASYRYEPNSVQGVYTDAEFFKNLEYACIKEADKESGKIKCNGAEELVFSVKPLAKNFTQAYYLLDLAVSDGKVEFCLHDLSFNVDMGEGQFVRTKAEDWISDKECINKKGQLRRIPGKFRIKTIDLVAELKKEIAETINK